MLYEQQEADAFQWAWAESHVTLPDCVLFTSCQSSFIHHRKRYLLPGERWWWHKMSKQEGWLNTYISFCLILTNDTKTTTERKGKKKHPKFSKPTKKMGEELAANKRCQQTSGSSETEHKRKLKATLAARESVALRIRPLHNMPQKAQELQTASCSELQGRVDHRLDF